MFKLKRNTEKIQHEIIAKRELMIDCALRNGFTNDETIKISQELDVLLNRYWKLVSDSDEAKTRTKFNLKQLIKFWARNFVEI
ncbi:MAG: aspartyl-phosphate phosphatase Spo0E family protein [Bacillota bacterium]|nr:aspartyl-phosphate phosphatase Spo0E family protein [Bacillota bacterium]